LSEYYKDNQYRLDNHEQLREVFTIRDDPKLHPQIALQELVNFCALARNVDFLSETDNRAPVITVHQAKGLEFDTVFLTGVVDGEFPSYLAVQDGKLEEVKRVFYVGITRAKRQLYLTGFRVNSRGWIAQPSRFISQLDRDNVEFISTESDYYRGN
jgi:DNA helicase-2/ATP-dependent DNA helicase PcrA